VYCSLASLYFYFKLYSTRIRSVFVLWLHRNCLISAAVTIEAFTIAPVLLIPLEQWTPNVSFLKRVLPPCLVFNYKSQFSLCCVWKLCQVDIFCPTLNLFRSLGRIIYYFKTFVRIVESLVIYSSFLFLTANTVWDKTEIETAAQKVCPWG
jgi:hypothetical protein